MLWLLNGTASCILIAVVNEKKKAVAVVVVVAAGALEIPQQILRGK